MLAFWQPFYFVLLQFIARKTKLKDQGEKKKKHSAS